MPSVEGLLSQYPSDAVLVLNDLHFTLLVLNYLRHGIFLKQIDVWQKAKHPRSKLQIQSTYGLLLKAED